MYIVKDPSMDTEEEARYKRMDDLQEQLLAAPKNLSYNKKFELLLAMSETVTESENASDHNAKEYHEMYDVHWGKLKSEREHARNGASITAKLRESRPTLATSCQL